MCGSPMANTDLMPTPGAFDPVPTPRDITPRADGRVDLIGLPKARIRELFEAAGLDAKAAKLRSKQVFHWLYHRGVTEFEAMTDIAKTMRPWLTERFVIGRPEVVEAHHSTDGTRKWVLRTADGNDFEMVFIPDADRGTLCISSQVGCTLNCRFCHTGTMRLVRNLTPGEIVGQVMLARDSLGEWPKGSMAGLDEVEDSAEYTSDGRLLTNIVLMGMGEPLYNFDNVAKALRIIMDPEGISVSKRRITLSTSGVVPMMARCGDELGVNLAVSLHACTDDLRDQLVPINRKHPIKELLKACRAYPGANNARRITFEYVMLEGINDSAADAKELLRLVRGIPAKFNLIPFNPWPGAPFECSSPATMKRFAKILNDSGLSAPIRAPRGRDIMAACGQLKSASQRQRRKSTTPKDAPKTAIMDAGE